MKAFRESRAHESWEFLLCSFHLVVGRGEKLASNKWAQVLLSFPFLPVTHTRLPQAFPYNSANQTSLWDQESGASEKAERGAKGTHLPPISHPPFSSVACRLSFHSATPSLGFPHQLVSTRAPVPQGCDFLLILTRDKASVSEGIVE